MLKLNITTQFKRDLKLCKKRNYNINLLNAIVNTLRIAAELPPKNKDHALKGNYSSETGKTNKRLVKINSDEK